MATVINNPSSDASGGAGWGVAIILVILVAIALLFGLPALRDTQNPSVTVPDTIDVNINGQ